MVMRWCTGCGAACRCGDVVAGGVVMWWRGGLNGTQILEFDLCDDCPLIWCRHAHLTRMSVILVVIFRCDGGARCGDAVV